MALNAHLSGMTKKQAMLEAGYSPKSLSSTVFGREDVKYELARRQETAAAKCEISQDWVVKRLAEMADSGAIMAKYKKVMPDGQLDWDFTGATQADLALIEELTVVCKDGAYGMKIGLPRRQAALDALCRVLGYNKDKVDVSGEISLVERLQRGRDRVRDNSDG